MWFIQAEPSQTQWAKVRSPGTPQLGPPPSLAPGRCLCNSYPGRGHQALLFPIHMKEVVGRLKTGPLFLACCPEPAEPKSVRKWMDEWLFIFI